MQIIEMNITLNKINLHTQWVLLCYVSYNNIQPMNSFFVPLSSST